MQLFEHSYRQMAPVWQVCAGSGGDAGQDSAAGFAWSLQPEAPGGVPPVPPAPPAKETVAFLPAPAGGPGGGGSSQAASWQASPAAKIHLLNEEVGRIIAGHPADAVSRLRLIVKRLVHLNHSIGLDD